MPISPIASTPEPPYFAVIFTSCRTEGDHGYEEAAKRMVDLAKQQQGFLGVESVRGAEGVGITVSYWQTEQDIREWKRQDEHLAAQQRGKTLWYGEYAVRIAKVERAYFNKAS